MKKVVMIISGCALLAASTTTVLASEGAYVSAHGGVALASDSDYTEPGVTGKIEVDTGFAVDGALGYDFGNFRLEGEVAFQKHDLDKGNFSGMGITLTGVDLIGEISALAFLANGYVDFSNDSPLTPYIMVGAGVANIDVDNFGVANTTLTPVSDDDTVFAYQAGVGVGIDVSETVTIDARYKYFGTSDPEFDTAETEFGSHNFLLGLRVSF